MTTEAHIQIDHFGRNLAVTVIGRRDNGASIYYPGNEGSFDRWEHVDPGTVPPSGPSYRFPDEVAKALLEALLDHYRGGHDARECAFHGPEAVFAAR